MAAREIVAAGLGFAVALAVSACSASEGASQPEQAGSCVVSLHGKGQTGSGTTTADGIAYVAPTGNADGWGARQWDYLDAAAYDDAVAVVADSIDEAGCSAVAIHGFSNGGAFAAKLFCQGETFGGALVGVVIDDPVPDSATTGCASAPAVSAALYWTGALAAAAPPGTDCATIDWTCEGGVTIDIDVFADEAGLTVLASPFDQHQRYDDAPEPLRWLDAVG